MKKTTSAGPTKTHQEEPLSPSKPEGVPVQMTKRKSGVLWAGPAVWWQQAGRFVFAGWGGKKARPARLAPSDPGQPVQQELALENVKPCRNDLSDADWEMVPPLASGSKRSFFRKRAGGGGSAPFARERPSFLAPAERV